MFFKKSSSKPSTSTPMAPQGQVQPTASSKSPYRPLRQDVDSIRLVKIHPAREEAGPIACDLIEVSFGERHHYEALSYTWGDESSKKPIVLNGTKFMVGHNLFDALHYLRRYGSGAPVWIDALCINQVDIPERNRQLRLMHHVYFRASTVVVWLGQKYNKHQMQISQTRIASEKQAVERQLVKDLIQNGYWDRLWIIQEVGHARKLQVCFGSQAMAWDGFMKFIRSYSNHDQGPLKLARQVERKYAGAHNLRELVYTHQHALCKDPRDKIFGLVGLAHDAADFPIDYGKSLVEVWVDTMEFMNRHRLFERETDIIQYGSLIKFLLMGKNSPQQADPDFLEPRTGFKPIQESERATTNPQVFHLRGVALGQLISVGPSVRDITGSFAKSNDWETSIRKNFNEDLDNARRESDVLLRSIFSPEGRALEALHFSNVSQVVWADQYRSSSEQRGTVMGQYVSGLASKGESKVSILPQKPSSREASSGIALCQIRGPQKNKVWRMGLTTSEAQQGDLVFWVRGTKTALLLRVEQRNGRDGTCSRLLQICGTAIVTQDVVGEKVDHEKRYNSFVKEEELALRMDARMILSILS